MALERNFKRGCGLGACVLLASACTGVVGGAETAEVSQAGLESSLPTAGAVSAPAAADDGGERVAIDDAFTDASPVATERARATPPTEEASVASPNAPAARLTARLRTQQAAGFSPLEVVFSQPQDMQAQVEFRAQGASGLLAADMVPVGERNLLGFKLVPRQPWPAGRLVLDVDVDERSAVIDMTVPAAKPATADASFEDLQSDVWLGKSVDAFAIPTPDAPNQNYCLRETSADYTVWAERERFVALPPTDGEWMAVCSGEGQLMQGYLEVPADATRVAIDAGMVDYDSGKVGGELRITLRDAAGQVQALNPDSPLEAGAEPAFHTFAVDIDRSLGTAWLVVEFASPHFENGDPSGAVFLDGLRFE